MSLLPIKRLISADSVKLFLCSFLGISNVEELFQFFFRRYALGLSSFVRVSANVPQLFYSSIDFTRDLYNFV